LREFAIGPPWVNERHYTTESEYEYGSRAGFWRLFRLFTKYGLKYTLYAVAQACEEQPEVVKRSVDGGHDVASQ
jgi:peptidoglycan/xylan/chitin deacetylase (PgdA/CDA1 family)